MLIFKILKCLLLNQLGSYGNYGRPFSRIKVDITNRSMFILGPLLMEYGWLIVEGCFGVFISFFTHSNVQPKSKILIHWNYFSYLKRGINFIAVNYYLHSS